MRDVSAKCRHCNETETVQVGQASYNRYLLREGSVQSLFRELSKEDREVLIGERAGYFICRVCWSVVFGEEDEDE